MNQIKLKKKLLEMGINHSYVFNNLKKSRQWAHWNFKNDFMEYKRMLIESLKALKIKITELIKELENE